MEDVMTIVFAPPRYGKTVFCVNEANIAGFDRQRNRSMQNEIVLKQASGFEAIKTVPQHCVASNIPITMRKFGYSPRHSRLINPYRLGYDNEHVNVHFTLPYQFTIIDEAQKYLNSRMSLYYPDWQSRYYEQCGHDYLRFLFATQRPELIDVNIRALCNFIEIMKLDLRYDDFNKVKRLTWLIRRIESNSAYEAYISSGKKDKGCYIEDIVTADYNVFDCYDSRNCKPKFYKGHMNEDFDYIESEPTEENYAAYIKYLLENDDELPENFYIKRKAIA